MHREQKSPRFGKREKEVYRTDDAADETYFGKTGLGSGKRPPAGSVRNGSKTSFISSRKTVRVKRIEVNHARKRKKALSQDEGGE